RHRRTPAEGIGAVFGERYGRRGTQSASDNSAIIPAHHHDGGARLAGAAVGEVRLGAVGAGVLDPNEDCTVVGREGDAGDLAAIGAGGEAADLAGCGIGAEHLVVAHALVFTAVAEVAVGFDPQPAVGVEGEAVGAVEHVVGSDVVAAGVRSACMDERVAGDDKKVPVEIIRTVVAIARRPADDLAIEIACAWVGGVDRLVFAHSAAVVVGEGAEHVTIVRMNGEPFGSIHGGSSDGGGGEACVDQ